MENTLENAEKFAAKCPTQNRIGLLCSRKPPNKELNRSQVEPSLGAGERGLEVFRQAAVSIEPRQCAFDNPATGKHRKTRDIGAALDDFDRPVAKLGDRAVEPVASIGAVGKQMAQPGKQVVDGANDKRGTIAILHIGGVDFSADQQAQRVGDDLALATFDLLAGIIATRTAALGGLDRLAVDDPRRGAGFAPGRFARLQ